MDEFICESCGEPFEEGQTCCLNPSCPEGAYNLAMERGDQRYHAAVDRELCENDTPTVS